MTEHRSRIYTPTQLHRRAIAERVLSNVCVYTMETMDPLDEILQWFPKEKRAWFYKGLYHFSRIDFYRSRRFCPLDESFPDERRNEFDEQLKQLHECFDRAIEIDPDYADAWFYKGRGYLHNGQFSDAVVCFSFTISADPFHWQSWYDKVLTFVLLRNNREVMSCCHYLVVHDLMFFEHFFGLAHVLKDIKKTRYVIKILDELFPFMDSLGWLRRGKFMHELHFIEEALHCFEQALVLNENNKDAWLAKAQFLHDSYSDVLSQKDIEKCLDKAIALDASCTEAWYWRGMYYQQKNNYHEAIRCYLHIGDRYVYKFLSECLEAIGRNEEAQIFAADSAQLFIWEKTPPDMSPCLWSNRYYTI